jgi:hypothetical protein
MKSADSLTIFNLIITIVLLYMIGLGKGGGNCNLNRNMNAISVILARDIHMEPILAFQLLR